VKTAVRNSGGGYFNHALFWQMMGPGGGGMPDGKLMEAINSSFGSFDSFKAAFSKAAKTLFGSGWAWVVADAQGKLEIMQTHNQDTPLASQKTPVLGIDVWEHAYYLQYENKRAEYVENFWSIINWEQCEKNYAG
jgi:Fe-Mn family superoxide dismutase